MDLIINEAGDRRIISFGSRLTIEEVSEIHSEIRRYMSDEMITRLDFDDVSECDPAGIQMLVSVLKSQDSGGVTLSIGKVSDVICNTANKLGINLKDNLYIGRGKNV